MMKDKVFRAYEKVRSHLESVPTRIWPFLRASSKRVPFLSWLDISRGDVLAVTLFAVLQLLICLGAIIDIAGGDSEEAARGLGQAVQWNMGFLLFPLPKRFSPLLMLLNVSFERAIQFHRWIAYWTIVLTFLHFIGLVFDNDMAEFSNVMGLFAMGCFFLLFLTSIVWIRRLLYEFFIKNHYVWAIGAYIGALLHEDAGGLIGRVLIFALIYGVDWAIRIKDLINHPGSIEDMLVFNNRSLRLCIRVPGRYIVEAGQYVYLLIPAVSKFQSHPFSVASVTYVYEHAQTAHLSANDAEPSIGVRWEQSLDGYIHLVMHPSTTAARIQQEYSILTFYPKALGNWTKSLSHVNKLSIGDRVYVDGPVGSVRVPLDRYDRIVLISGGFGVTPMIPIWSSLLRAADQPHVTLKTVLFWWTIRAADTALFKDVIQLLHPPELCGPQAVNNSKGVADRSGESAGKCTSVFEGRVFLTRLDDLSEAETVIDVRNTGLFQVHTHGRMDVHSLLGDVATYVRNSDLEVNSSSSHALRAQEPRVAVLVCGPPVLIEQTMRAAHFHSQKHKSVSRVHFDVHRETFEL